MVSKILLDFCDGRASLAMESMMEALLLMLWTIFLWGAVMIELFLRSRREDVVLPSEMKRVIIKVMVKKLSMA